ncbi:MAG: endonuclease/exonuclease/phosphatase family protein [Cyanothece sp. SIO2G6]|nr:endonuclease/exonuclease/phosphatase family protein [Cyanothece sp. SIO2G6]
MKIVSWNCAGALRKKTKEVDALNADLLVIQECENPDLSTNEYKSWAGNYLWVGTNKNKGLGIFSKNRGRIERLHWNGSFKIDGLSTKSSSTSWKTEELELFLPCLVNDTYTVLGVWTKGGNDQVFSYVGQFWKYLKIHSIDLFNPDTLIIGDFNSNAIWDKKDRWWSHSDITAELKDIEIESVYHFQTGEQQGKETKSTFFHHKNLQKSYHIDYAFCSRNLLNLSSIDIGKPEDWLTISDHVPLSVTINS